MRPLGSKEARESERTGSQDDQKCLPSLGALGPSPPATLTEGRVPLTHWTRFSDDPLVRPVETHLRSPPMGLLGVVETLGLVSNQVSPPSSPSMWGQKGGQKVTSDRPGQLKMPTSPIPLPLTHDLGEEDGWRLGRNTPSYSSTGPSPHRWFTSPRRHVTNTRWTIRSTCTGYVRYRPYPLPRGSTAVSRCERLNPLMSSHSTVPNF